MPPSTNLVLSNDDSPVLHAPNGGIAAAAESALGMDPVESSNSPSNAVPVPVVAAEAERPVNTGPLDLKSSMEITAFASEDQSCDMDGHHSLQLTDSSACSTSDGSDDEEKVKTILSEDGKFPTLPLNVLLLSNENTELKRLLHFVQNERDLLQKQLMEKSTEASGTNLLRTYTLSPYV